MIIVKTKNGDRFINEKVVTEVTHDKENARVSYYGENGSSTIPDVESVTYISDTQAATWTDKGSEVKRLEETLAEREKKISDLYDFTAFLREWFKIFEDAIGSIEDSINMAQLQNKEVIACPTDIIDEAREKYNKSLERFKKARDTWDTI